MAVSLKLEDADFKDHSNIYIVAYLVSETYSINFESEWVLFFFFLNWTGTSITCESDWVWVASLEKVGERSLQWQRETFLLLFNKSRYKLRYYKPQLCNANAFCKDIGKMLYGFSWPTTVFMIKLVLIMTKFETNQIAISWYQFLAHSVV